MASPMGVPPFGTMRESALSAAARSGAPSGTTTRQGGGPGGGRRPRRPRIRPPLEAPVEPRRREDGNRNPEGDSSASRSLHSGRTSLLLGREDADLDAPVQRVVVRVVGIGRRVPALP